MVNLNEKFDFKLQFRSRQVRFGYKHFSPNPGLEVGGGYVSLGAGFIALETDSMKAILKLDLVL